MKMTADPRPLRHPALALPPLDPISAPWTGLTREHWEAVADQLLLALRPHATERGAQIRIPGPASDSGVSSDGLEGFARSFLLAAALLAGRQGEDAAGHIEFYADGLAAGVEPGGSDAWPRIAECAQAKVEACCLALALDLTRPWIWDRLEEITRRRLVDWFAEVIGTSYPPVNWVWFRIIVLTFLRSVDEGFATGPDAALLRDDLERDLAVHESCAREGGWFRDGPTRAVDHYNTWAFSLLPTLWLRMRGTDQLAEDGLVTMADSIRHRERAAHFTADALGLVGSDGGPLMQGRSLVYRMASAAPFWGAALAGLAEGGSPRLSPGQLRRAASGELAHFLRRGVPDGDGLLTLGWFHAYPRMAQSYSGPGSPYWASMGFLGLILPGDHPVWSAPEEALPVEKTDAVETLPVPGWIVSRTRADGLVRVVNHGTDHALPGQLLIDSPLYARMGYSTATCPPLTGGAAEEPGDNIVAIVHPAYGWSHRTGFDRVALGSVRVPVPRPGQTPEEPPGPGAGVSPASGPPQTVAVAVSRQECHWVEAEPSDSDHGHGRQGAATAGAVLTVASIVRGAAEIRVVRAEGATRHPVAVAGWPLAGEGALEEEAASRDPAVQHTADLARAGVRQARAAAGVRLAQAGGGALISTMTGLRGSWNASVHRESDTTPLGREMAVPQLRCAPLRTGDVVAVQVELRGHESEAEHAPEVVVDPNGLVTVIWPDGAAVTVDLDTEEGPVAP